VLGGVKSSCSTASRGTLSPYDSFFLLQHIPVTCSAHEAPHAGEFPHEPFFGSYIGLKSRVWGKQGIKCCVQLQTGLALLCVGLCFVKLIVSFFWANVGSLNDVKYGPRHDELKFGSCIANALRMT